MEEGRGPAGMLRKISMLAVLPVLTLLVQPAWALDVDRIEVKSRIGEPLLAEIPVVSADAAELKQLQVQLASAATFARIGLERPRGAVSDLRFEVVRNARGNAVIRVTTSAPVQQDFLTFLVQVDWGSGRMVREYSVALDGPDTLAAPALSSIQAPEAAPSNSIGAPVAIPLAGDGPPVAPAPATVAPIPLAGRAPAPAAVATPSPSAQPATKAAAKPVAKRADPATPVPVPVPAPVAKPSPPMKAPVVGQDSAGYGPVKPGDTLTGIATRLVGGDYSLNQAMLALLRVNPDAFVGGNINLLKRGAVLRTPQPAELARFSVAEAEVMVRDQNDQWRNKRPVQPQPAALPPMSPAPPAAAAGTPRIAEARLEISPPAREAAPLPGGQSGMAASGSGDTLRHEPQKAPDEASASLEAEVLELKARVEALDKLQRQQQALIALKEKELAARPATTSGMSWGWLLAALVLLPFSTWWLLRRRESLPAKPFPGLEVAAVPADQSGDAMSREGDPAEQSQSLPYSPAWHWRNERQSIDPEETGTTVDR
jgi:pilus assembly protein FimV